MKTITISIITYNQEDTIGRAIESLLNQKEWGLYQIVISDDCSKDNTWKIVQEYQTKYPGIIFPHRNDHNLGIYENLAELRRLLKQMPESDLYGELSGDDEYCDAYFEGIQKLIKKEKIDTTKAIGIYSDWKKVASNGEETIYKQNIVLSGYPLFSLKMRGKISSRSLLVSKKVRDAYGPFILNKGLNLAESNYDAQPHLHIDKAYYLGQITSIYYTGIGISTRLSDKRSAYLTTQAIEKWKYGIENYIQDHRDFHYATCEIIKANYFVNPTWKGFCRTVYHYIKGQLPGCRNSLLISIRMFLGLMKYKFLFKS